MMFGDDTHNRDLAERMFLDDLSLEDIMEMNNLDEVDVLAALIEAGLIKYPEVYL